MIFLNDRRKTTKELKKYNIIKICFTHKQTESTCSSTCEVVEEVEGEGEAGGLRVEHGRLRIT